MFTHKKTGFEQSNVITIVALPVVVGTIIMLVGNTATGLACGTGYVQYAFLFLILLGIVLLVMNKLNFGKPISSHMTLKISIPEDLNYLGLFDSVLDKYCTSWNLQRVKTTEFGSLFDLVFNVEVSNLADQKKFLDELRTLNGNLNITLVLNRKDDKIYA